MFLKAFSFRVIKNEYFLVKVNSLHNNKNFYLFNPFPNDTFFYFFKLKGFADNNLNFDENGKKFSKRVENTVLVMSNFSFSLSVFKRLKLQTRKNHGLFGKGLTLYHTILAFNDLEKEAS